MIRTEEEYRAAMRELRHDRRIAREQERLLAGFGLKPGEIWAALAPIRAQTEKLRHQAAAYERARKAGGLPNRSGS